MRLVLFTTLLALLYNHSVSLNISHLGVVLSPNDGDLILLWAR